MHCSTSVLEARLDWLTATCRDGNGADELAKVGQELVEQEEQLGNFKRLWRWKAYEGQHAGMVTWGRRQDGTIIQCSQWAAEQHYDKLHSLVDNWTRIDVCVTVRFDPPREGVADASFWQSLAYQPKRGIKPQSKRITGSDGGSTTYIGTPISDVYGRVYNKEAESKRPEYRQCWRWECEYKAELADAIGNRYACVSDRQRFCQDVVHSYFTRRGQQLPWTTDHNYLPPIVRHPPTDVARKLAWLGQTVKPTMAHLIEHGYVGQALAALGLAEEVCIVGKALHPGGRGHHATDTPDEDTP